MSGADPPVPRAVSPWTWRRALRDYAPNNVLLTMYTIGTYMDRSGIAWPSQQTIAKGARASVRTVQRHIATAHRAGWLGIELAGHGGKGWRHYVYRAAVPNGLQLEFLDDEIADAITAQEGAIEGDDTIVSPRLNGSDTAMSPPSAGNAPALQVRGDNGGQNVATNQHEGGDTGDVNVATQLCRTNSRSETPPLRTHAKEAHNAQSRVARSVHGLKKKGSGTRRRAYTPTELRKRVKAYHDARMQPDDIVRACLQGASSDDIRRALHDECGVACIIV